MRRSAGVAGLVFVVLAFVSEGVHGSRPDTSKRDALAKVTSFYSTRTHDSHALVSAVVGIIGLFFFAWFLGGLWSALRAAEGGTSAPTILVAVAGAAFFALAALGHVVSNVIGISLHFDKGYQLDPGLAMVMLDLGTGIFLAATMAAGVMTLAAGVLMIRNKAFPLWVAIIGFVVTVVALPVIPPLAFIGAIVLAVWVAVLSVMLVATPEPSA